MPKCLIRCDGSTSIGHGHIVRCLSLAQIMTSVKGWNIEFAVLESDDLIIKKISENGFKINTVIFDRNFYSEEEDWLKSLLFKENKFDCFIMDLKKVYSEQFFFHLKIKNIKVINIDDSSNKRLYSDLNLYPPVPDAYNLEWDNFKGINKIGWEYVILRNSFTNIEIPENDSKEIIISAGGSDPNNLTCLIIKSIYKLIIKKDFKLLIVLGSNYSFENELKKALNLDLRYRIYKNIDSDTFVKLIDKSKFGIITYGTTAFEFLARAKPSIHLCFSENHNRCSKMFEDKGLAINLGETHSLREEDLKRKTETLIENKLLLKNLTKNAKFISKNFSQNKISNLLEEIIKI